MPLSHTDTHSHYEWSILIPYSTHSEIAKTWFIEHLKEISLTFISQSCFLSFIPHLTFFLLRMNCKITFSSSFVWCQILFNICHFHTYVIIQGHMLTIRLPLPIFKKYMNSVNKFCFTIKSLDEVDTLSVKLKVRKISWTFDFICLFYN